MAADHPLCAEHARLLGVLDSMASDLRAARESQARQEERGIALADRVDGLAIDLRAMRDSPPIAAHLVERALAPEVLRWIVALVLAVAIALGAVSVSELAPLILPVASGSQTPDDPPAMEAIP